MTPRLAWYAERIEELEDIRQEMAQKLSEPLQMSDSFGIALQAILDRIEQYRDYAAARVKKESHRHTQFILENYKQAGW